MVVNGVGTREHIGDFSDDYSDDLSSGYLSTYFTDLSMANLSLICYEV